MYLKEFRPSRHSCISKVTSFGPFYGPSDLFTRTHERNYKIIYITFLYVDRYVKKEIHRWTCKEEISFCKVVNEWLCSWPRVEIPGTKASCIADGDVILEQDDGQLSERVTRQREQYMTPLLNRYQRSGCRLVHS